MNASHAPLGSFEELVDDYDRYRIGYAPEVYDAVFHYGLAADDRVLDVGCGTGLVALELGRRGCRVSGLDASEGMLARARHRVPGASFTHGCAEALPFGDATFDAATSAQAFHWFDQRRAFAELTRVVRPGGTVAIWWKGFMRGAAIRLLREEAARAVGCCAPCDAISIANDFDAYENVDLVDKVIRIVPWIVRMRVADFLGYERSRVLARNAYGERFEAYFAALGERLGSRDGELSLPYVQLVYLGRIRA